MKKRQATKPRRNTDLLSSIKSLAEYLDKSAEKARNKEPRDWSHDHGFQRGKAAAYTWAAKLARRCLDSAGGMARELAAQDSESPTKQNG